MRDVEIYENEVFNPYEDLIFSKSDKLEDKIDIQKIEYQTKEGSNALDTTKAGECEITYTLLIKDHTVYTFKKFCECSEKYWNL